MYRIWYWATIDRESDGRFIASIPDLGDLAAYGDSDKDAGVDPVRPDTRRVENRRECIRVVSGSPAANADARCCNPPSRDRSEQALPRRAGSGLPGHSRA